MMETFMNLNLFWQCFMAFSLICWVVSLGYVFIITVKAIVAEIQDNIKKVKDRIYWHNVNKKKGLA